MQSASTTAEQSGQATVLFIQPVATTTISKASITVADINKVNALLLKGFLLVII
jgi:hypothetical protein